MTELINETDQRSGSLSAFGAARSTVKGAPLKADELREMDAYFRASLYLCLGMIYLRNRRARERRGARFWRFCLGLDGRPGGHTGTGSVALGDPPDLYGGATGQAVDR